ncbi:MAG TPA: hypothetical protein VMW72_17490 [Sedimentisphaerales bacterium]|nr:hypothetical protein [Sedimentisphaerales bacterium]
MGIDTMRVLPHPDESFSIIYSGEMDADSVSNYLLGCSLYVDKIFVVNPFPNPCCIKKEYNPIYHPSQYKVATYRLLFVLGMLEHCIRAGIVQIIPNPFEVDFQFRGIMLAQAEKRKKLFKIGEKETELMARKFQREMLWLLPEEHFRKTIKEINPSISEQETDQVIKYLAKVRESEPSQYLQTLDQTGHQLTLHQYGINLETLVYLCHLTGSIPYTYINLKQKELGTISVKSDDSLKWKALSDPFSSLKFRFLNLAIDPFIVAMRAKGLFKGFRSYLRKIKNIRLEKPAVCPTELVDILENEYKQVEKDWEFIEKELKDALGSEFLEHAGGAYFYGNIIPYFEDLSLECVVDHLKSKFGKEHVSDRIPMSIYGKLSEIS